MVIAYFPDGSMEHTLKDSFFKPAHTGSLEPLPRREIVRMTEILPAPEGQTFWIRFKTGPFAEHKWGWSVLHEMVETFRIEYETIRVAIEGSVERNHAYIKVYEYRTYEAAVEAEILIMDLLRSRGYSLAA